MEDIPVEEEKKAAKEEKVEQKLESLPKNDVSKLYRKIVVKSSTVASYMRSSDAQCAAACFVSKNILPRRAEITLNIGFNYDVSFSSACVGPATIALA